jgi:probable HAF family extracellular repeat protein
VVYVVEDLGVLEDGQNSVARAINEDGDVVGFGYTSGGTRAFRYTDESGLENLGRPSGVSLSDGWDINVYGDVAGVGGPSPYWYSDSDGWQYLGTLGGGGGQAYAINDNQLITGFSYIAGFVEPHAFLYNHPDNPGVMIDIVPGSSYSFGRGLNNAGQVAGYMLAGGYRAFRWTDGVLEDLGVLDGMAHSFGYDINESGQVTGYSSSASGDAARIFRYTDGLGMEDLGGLGEDNIGWGINSRGDVVGRGDPGAGLAVAVLYTDEDGLQDLNDLIDPESGWFLGRAFDINDVGQIAGVGTNSLGESHGVRLNPVSSGTEPGEEGLPEDISLNQNHPNPFNASTSISYSIESPSRVKLEIFDVLGRRTEVLVDRYQQPGRHIVVWDASNWPGGVYFYRLDADGHHAVRKMVLLK